jgi:hypothetical protein
VKLGTFEFDEAAENLLRLKEKTASAIQPPSFLAIITATSGIAYMREDGVAVIPLDVLGP